MTALNRQRKRVFGFSATACAVVAMHAALAGTAFAADISAGDLPASDVPPDAPLSQPVTPAQPGGPVSILPDLPDEPFAAQEPSIAVGDLAAPGIDRIGLVDTAAGGFSAQLWRGTDFALLKHILPQLPQHAPSPALRRLTRNLLLSPGAPPAMAAADDINEPNAVGEVLSASQWLLEVRAGTLAAQGDWDEVQALLDLAPVDQLTEGLRRLKTEANLVTNHASEACAQTQVALSASPDTYWQKIQVFCQLDIDQTNAASLGIALLREQKLDDPMFFWAVDTFGGARPPLPSAFTKLEPLHYAMLRKVDAPMPANIADVHAKITDASTLGWLASLALPDNAAIKGDKTPAATRAARRRAMEEAQILMAERAVAAGTLEPAALRGLYRSVNIKDPAPPPLSQVKAGDTRGRALLFQSALMQTVPAARAEVITLAIELVRADAGAEGPDLMVMGPAYAEMISEMEPTTDLMWFAGTAARALTAAGPEDRVAAERARGWFNLARNLGRTSREAGLIADSLWPIEAVMIGGTAVPPQAVRGWAAALPADTAAEIIAERTQTVLSLLMAVGAQVSSSDWTPVMAQPARADSRAMLAPHVWNGLTLAAKGNRAGETAALALVAVGDHKPGTIAVPGLQHVIESLRAAGREDDARALSVEAMLSLGL